MTKLEALEALKAKVEAVDALVEAAWQHIEAYPIVEDSDQQAKRDALEAALKAIKEGE